MSIRLWYGRLVLSPGRSSMRVTCATRRIRLNTENDSVSSLWPQFCRLPDDCSHFTSCRHSIQSVGGSPNRRRILTCRHFLQELGDAVSAAWQARMSRVTQARSCIWPEHQAGIRNRTSCALCSGSPRVYGADSRPHTVVASNGPCPQQSSDRQRQLAQGSGMVGHPILQHCKY